MRFLFSLLAAMVLSLGLGIGSAWYMVAAPRTGTIAVDGWEALEPIGADSADPYVRARVARTGEITMGAGEGLTFLAHRDEDGRGLVASCDYEIAGTMPPARLWTLAAVDDAGRLGATTNGRTYVQSRDLLFDGDGRFAVTVAATARPGNWLPAPQGGAFRLTLRLYDTPLVLAADHPPTMPKIFRRDCR